MDAQSAGLLGGIVALAMALVKLLEMFAKPLIEDRMQARRTKNGRGSGGHRSECALSYDDRAQLVTLQGKALEKLERNNEKQLEVLQAIHREHGGQLERLVDALVRPGTRT